MNDLGGFIVVYRDILKWEWYTDVNTAHLFVHCILKANHTAANWRGIEIKRGSFITSLQKLSTETGLTVMQVRTSLEKLEKTGDITNQSTSKYRIITVKNYDSYQRRNKQNSKQNSKVVTSKIANKYQGDNNQIATNNNNNNKNNDNTGVGVCAYGTHTPTPPEKEKMAGSLSVTPPVGVTGEPPLTESEWRAYCRLKGKDAYEAAQLWPEYRGRLNDEAVRQLRECLKNG